MRNITQSASSQKHSTTSVLPIHKSLAVVLVDVRTHPVNNLYPEDKERFMTNVINLIKYCANKNIPILNAGFQGHYETIDDTPQEIRAELNNVYKVLPCIKYSTNLFERSKAAKILQDWNVHTLFVAGINATGCAYDSAVGALSVPSTIKTQKMRVATSLDIIANEIRAVGMMNGCKEKYVSSGVECYNIYTEFFDKLN